MEKGSSSLKILATLSPTVATVTSHSQRRHRNLAQKLQMLKWPIDGKMTSLTAVDGRKLQRARWGTKFKWWRHRKLAKLLPIEVAIMRNFKALIGSLPNVFWQQGWHGDDPHCMSFRWVSTLARVVAGNERSG
ncbi:hypothetical protein AB3S75_002283 [Citrus x aurantiifolia]